MKSIVESQLLSKIIGMQENSDNLDVNDKIMKTSENSDNLEVNDKIMKNS